MKKEYTEEKQEQETRDYIRNYKESIHQMLDEIENPVILMKIHTVVKTHLEILKEKEQED